MRRVEAGGLTFGVSADPEVRASAFVLVHGIGMSHRSMRRLAGALPDDARVVVVDMPGHADLPRPDRSVDVAAMALALAGVLDGLGVQRAVLVGHSMGAQWVVELAAIRPDLAAGVVIIGPVADARRRSAPAQTAALALDTLTEPPNVNAIAGTDYMRCGMVWYLAQTRHMLDYPIESRVAALTVPLLVMRGGRDPIATLRWCRLLRSRAARASVVEIPGHAHVVQHVAPRAVAAAIVAHAQGW
jgi:pimeloyl-ACP methyl ester carboxylesterase